jgi:hypothetical protein
MKASAMNLSLRPFSLIPAYLAAEKSTRPGHAVTTIQAGLLLG